jgi:hypothetical protein
MLRKTCTLNKAEVKEICRRFKAGEPVEAIGKRFDLSGGSVSNVAIANGCPPRRRSAARALENRTLKIDLLKVVDCDGEPRVVDTVLGAALGYDRPRDLRKLIERHREKLEKIALARHRGAPIKSGKGRIEQVTEYLLTREQINYLITRCGLPNADHYCLLIAKVFTAWQEGRLVSTDAKTTIELQDAAEKAATAAPALSALAAMEKRINFRIAEAEKRIRDELSAFCKRRSPSSETKRQLVDTVALHFDGKCPCCRETRILQQGQKLPAGVFDHWTDNANKNDPDKMWLICADCNTAFQYRMDHPRKRSRDDYEEEWKLFQKYRRRVAKQQYNLLLA